jgi:hypothetical protein
MKRVGLFLFVLCAGILGIELALSVLRQRNIGLDIRAEGPRPAINTSAQPSNGQATPEAASAPGGSVYITPEGSVVVDVTWSYRIGPRFPLTTVRADIVDDKGEAVSSAAHTFECGGDTLVCEGKQALTLQYGEKDGQGAAQPWPVGTYALHVVRIYPSDKPEGLAAWTVQVIAN